ncbi:MAG: peptidoglycan-associated lipoprotein Pal [Bdellovibrionales bacterium]
MQTQQKTFQTWMIQLLSVVIMVSFALSCSKKKKDDGQIGEEVTEGQLDPNVANQALGFDPQGSDGGTIEGLKTVFFPYDSSTLTNDARKRLQGNADWMKQHAGTNIQIEGHCDEKGSIEYNLALGERRAKAVRSYLVSLGVDASRVSVISYGEEKPIESGDSEAVMAKNRRANFLPLGQ